MKNKVKLIKRLKLPKLKVMGVCSGIAGFEIAADKMCGGFFETVALCENNNFASNILRHRFPDAAYFNNIRKIDKESLIAKGVTRVNILEGGVPCQDFSRINIDRKHTDSTRNLFPEMLLLAELLREIDPQNCRWIIVENVPGFLDRGLVKLLEGLDRLGYDYQTFVYPAAALGYPQKRERVFVVAGHFGDKVCYIDKNKWIGITPRNFSKEILSKLSKIDPVIKTPIPLDSFSANTIQCAGNAVVPGQVLPIFQCIWETEMRLRFNNNYCAGENMIPVTVTELFTEIFCQTLMSSSLPFEGRWHTADETVWAPHMRLKISKLPNSVKEANWWPSILASFGTRYMTKRLGNYTKKYPELLTGKY